MDERIESFFENQNFTKMHAMFQMLFYFVYRRQKKTPLDVMTGHTVYDKCKSRELITALNKIGVSTSYNEVLKNRKKLADHVLASSINEGPRLPSHFSKDHFSICAFDNFDHGDRSSLYGTHSHHDTAVVMFQVKPDIIPSKPNVTAMNLPNSTEHFRNEPPCQRLRNYNKPKSSANLPPNFSVDEDLYQNEELQKDHHNKEFILSLILSLVVH